MQTLSREIIHQLRHNGHQGAQFELKESLRKGRLLDEEDHTLLTSTITQLAWVKDIDLTKGHSFLTDKDSLHSFTPSMLSASFFHTPTHAAGDSAMNTSVVTQLVNSKPQEFADRISLTPTRNKGRLLNNKVYPLNASDKKEEVINSFNTLHSFMLEGSESDISDDIFFDEQLNVEEKRQITNNGRSPIQGSAVHGCEKTNTAQDKGIHSVFSITAGLSSISKAGLNMSKSLTVSSLQSTEAQSSTTEQPEGSNVNQETHASIFKK